MSTLRISDAPLLPDVDGTEKIPTGGRGDYAISVDQIKGHIFQDVGKELVGLGNVDNTSDLDKPVSTAQQAVLDLKADKTYVDTNLDLKADKTNVYTRSETTLALSQKADLVGGVIPSNQLPSYVDDVVEYTTSTLPIVGESGKIYITTDTNRTWRWSGNQYVEISNGGVSDSTLKLQTPRKIANVDFDGTQDIEIPHNNLTGRDISNAHTAASISVASGETQQDVNDYTGAKWRNKAGGYALNARVMLDSGNIVKSTTSGNTANPNTDMTGWAGTGLREPLSILTKSLNRVLYDHVVEYVNAKDYGAIGDGVDHTIQKWVDEGRFSDLATVQLVFPHVTSLTDPINWAVFQLLINLRKNTYIPAGVYASSKTVHTKHSGSPNRVDSNVCFFGDGIQTVFTRLEVSQPATRVLNVNGEDDINAFDDINNNEAYFSVHGSYFKFTDCMFQNNKVGIYFGQDLTNSVEKSACYFNAIRDVVFRKNGTSIIMSSSGGNHYGNFQNIHFIEGQIDLEMRIGKHDVSGISNNNRNIFNNIRSNRSKVGLWCKSGDTNTFNAWHGEGCGANPVNNFFPAATGLPKLPSGTQITNSVHILDKLGQLNTISNSKMEACDIELFNNQVYNSFLNNRYHEAVAGGTQVYNLKEVALWMSADTMITPYFAYISNQNTNAFPTVLSAGFSYRGALPVRNNTGCFITKPTRTSTSYSEKRLYELGSATASELKTVSIWGDVDASSSANIKVRVSALSTVSNLSFANEFIICANRAANRGLGRYFLSEQSKLRASGQNAGDNSTVIVPTIINGGTSTRELILNLQMPAYAMDAVLVEVEMLVSKA